MADQLEVELDLDVRMETAAAWLVSDGDVEVWLPKSQVDYEEGTRVGRVCSFLVPEWLAEDRGLA